MVRIFPYLIALTTFLFGVLVVGPLGNLAYDEFYSRPVPIVLQRLTQLWPYILLSVAFIGGLTIWSFRQGRIDTKKGNFALLKAVGDLKPVDLGFEVAEKRNHANTHFRPFPSLYIPRKFTSDTQTMGDANPLEYSEEGLQESLINGGGFVLIGQPLEGKTRTLFEVVKSMSGYEIVVPFKDRPIPEDAVFSIMRKKNIILLLDDLNDFAGASLDLNGFCRNLTKSATNWVIAATCRDGPELGVVLGDHFFGLHRLFEDVAIKMRFVPWSLEDENHLAGHLGLDASTRIRHQYPNPGTMVMAKPMEAMRHRFENLSYEGKDLLRAIKLLISAGVIPITEQRILITLSSVFKRDGGNIVDILSDLASQAFLAPMGGFKESVYPELAYLDHAVSYEPSRLEREDLSQLREALGSISDIDGLKAMGWSEHMLSKHENELLTYDMALSIDSDDETVINNKALALGHLNRNTEALEILEQLIEQGTSTTWVWTNKAVALRELGRIPEALIAFEEALHIDSSFESALYGKCWCLYLSNDYDQVIRTYENAILSDSRLFDRWKDRASSLHQTGQYQDEVLIRDMLLLLKPDDADCLLAKGLALFHMTRYEETIDTLTRLTAQFGDSFNGWYFLGKSLLFVRKYQAALEAQFRAHELDTADAHVWLDIGLCYVQTDRRTEAIAWLCASWHSSKLSLEPNLSDTLTQMLKELEHDPENCGLHPYGVQTRKQ